MHLHKASDIYSSHTGICSSYGREYVPDSAENKGYDADKKISGIKRYIAVDTQGLPHAIHITTANVTDREGALSMFSGWKNVVDYGKTAKGS